MVIVPFEEFYLKTIKYICLLVKIKGNGFNISLRSLKIPPTPFFGLLLKKNKLTIQPKYLQYSKILFLTDHHSKAKRMWRNQ